MHVRNGVRGFVDRFGYLIRVDTASHAVALTFDDGPDPVSTPALLDVLARHGARATFFLDGPACERAPGLVRRITDEGHVVGVHGWAHLSAVNNAAMRGLRAQISDIRRGARAVGVKSSLYRPPFGHGSRWTRPAAWLLRYRLVYWSASVEDWEVTPSDDLAGRIKAELTPGAVILLHDRLRHAGDVRAFDRSYLVSAVAQVLDEADPEIRFVTVPELIALGSPILRDRPRSAPPSPRMVEQSA